MCSSDLYLFNLILPSLLFIKFGFNGLPLILAPLAFITYPLIKNDLVRKVLPNRLIYPAYSFTLIILGSFSFMYKSFELFVLPTALGLVFFVSGLVFSYITKTGFGGGDVKLLGLAGINLGLFSGAHVVMALIITAISSLATVLTLLITRKVSLRSKIAFGPFILLGTWASILIFG